MIVSMFSAILLNTSLWLHPFYISMTDIVYKPGAKTLQFSVRLFTDDFEKTLRKSCKSKVDLSDKDSKATMNPLVQQYILQHLKINVNGRDVILTFNGYQKEEESTWSFFEVAGISHLSQLK